MDISFISGTHYQPICEHEAAEILLPGREASYSEKFGMPLEGQSQGETAVPKPKPQMGSSGF